MNSGGGLMTSVMSSTDHMKEFVSKIISVFASSQVPSYFISLLSSVIKQGRDDEQQLVVKNHVLSLLSSRDTALLITHDSEPYKMSLISPATCSSA